MKIEYDKIDVFGPMVKDYNLNQCVGIRAQIKKYKARASNWYALVMIAFLTIWGLIAGAIWVLDWAGVITYVADEMRDLLGPLFIWLIICCVMLADGCGYDKLLKAINSRIDVLGGLDDGKKGAE